MRRYVPRSGPAGRRAQRTPDHHHPRHCLQTMRPLSFSIRLPIRTDKRFSVSASQILSLIAERECEPAVLATHGKVIASLFLRSTARRNGERFRSGCLRQAGGKVLAGRLSNHPERPPV